MTRVVGIPGTCGLDDPWVQLRSPLAEYLQTQDIALEIATCWTGRLALGTYDPTWQRGGEALARQYAGQRVRVIAHSHGGQVALFAAAAGLQLDVLMTIGTPARRDMSATIAVARPNIRFWLHICDPSFDLWGSLGALFAGSGFFTRKFKQADQTVRIPEMLHTRLLNEPEFFPLWSEDGLLDTLRMR